MEEKKENTYGIFEAFSDMMVETFVMDPSATGETTLVTSFDLRKMFRDLLDISINDITLIMMKLGFRPSMTSGTACWKLIKRRQQ